MITEEPRVLPTDHHLLTREKLARLGVRILNRYDLELECANCRERWMVPRLPGGRLAPGYWKCPNRCNW